MSAIVLFLVGILALLWIWLTLFVAEGAWRVLYHALVDVIELRQRWHQGSIDTDRQLLELATWQSRARYELQAQRQKLLEDSK